MTPEEHKIAHVALHKALDLLVADCISNVDGFRPSSSTVLELMRWSYSQTRKPSTPGDPPTPLAKIIGTHRIRRSIEMEREYQAVWNGLSEAGLIGHIDDDGTVDKFGARVSDVQEKLMEY